MFGLLCCALFQLTVVAQDAAPLDSNRLVRIGTITAEGNRVTKIRILLRELPFATGDTIRQRELTEMMERGRKNIWNTSLFTTVEVTQKPDSNGSAPIHIRVRERWYTWPEFTFDVTESNFNTWWESKDFSRVNYGVSATRYNFRGRRERLRLKFQYGWERKLELSYKTPFIDRKQTIGVGFRVAYSRNREVNPISSGHSREFFKSTERFVQEQFLANVEAFYRKGLYVSHSLLLEYQIRNTLDTVPIINPAYYGSGDQLEYLNMRYQIRYNRVDNGAYPTEGRDYEAWSTHYGFGIMNNNGLNINIIRIRLSNYQKLSPRWSLATAVIGKTTLFGDAPYILQRGLGFDDLVRGYELFVIDGQEFGLLKTEMRYNLLKQKNFELGFLPFKQFDDFQLAIFLTAFADAGFVTGSLDQYDPERFLDESMLGGAGMGINFVTYYDVVWRVEGALNRRGEFRPYFAIGKSF